MESMRASAAPWAPSAAAAAAMPTSPISRHDPFAGFVPARMFNAYGQQDDDVLGGGGGGVPPSSSSRPYSVSPKLDRRSLDQPRRSHDFEDGGAGTRKASTNGSASGRAGTPPTASVLLLRRLSASMSAEALNSMLIFASDLIDAKFVSSPQLASDRGHQAAVARFSTHDGAVEARNRLHGKVNASGDATIIGQVLQGPGAAGAESGAAMGGGGSSGIGGAGVGAAGHRRASDLPLARHMSGSASSAGSSNGHAAASPQARFSTAFQSLDQTASPTGKPSRGAPGHIDLSGTHFSSAQVQDLFSPTSPLQLPPAGGERARNSGKTLIGDDPAGDEETHELLLDPLAFAEQDQRQQRDARAAERAAEHHSHHLASQLGGLRLDTHKEHSLNGGGGHTANGGPSMLSPTLSSSFHRGGASQQQQPQQQQQQQQPPLQSPASEFSTGYGMSPLSPTSSAFPASPQFQRHQFPPANPADQNPPCNTLYVGNLPMDTLEEELKDLFSKQRGYKRLCFRTKHNGPMCFVEFEDVSFATKALNELYGSMLSNSLRSGIRLSFSKNPLGVRTGQANMHSPLTSPTGVGYGGLAGAPPPFSTAAGPPPGLAAPPGLNGSHAPGGAEGAHGGSNGHGHSHGHGLGNGSSYYARASPPQTFHTSSGAFLGQGMPLGYGVGGGRAANNAYDSAYNGFSDITPRRM